MVVSHYQVLYCECRFGVWHLPEGKLIHNNFTAWHSTINVANCDFLTCWPPVHKKAWSKLYGLNFSLRRHRSTFHRFLKMLACFDGLVVTCIFLMYALPVMCTTYKKVKHFSSILRAPLCQKSWWGQAHKSGVICPLGPSWIGLIYLTKIGGD